MRHAPGLRVFCLDSDPASMVERSGGWISAVQAGLTRRSFIRRVRGADLTILVGQGVESVYIASPGSCGRSTGWDKGVGFRLSLR